MATIEKREGKLVVKLGMGERVEGLHGDIEVPLERVRAVEPLENPIEAIHGLQPQHAKLVGTYLPGVTAVGTFLNGQSQRPFFAVVHRDSQRGVRIKLEGHNLSELIIGCQDPEAVRQELSPPADPAA